MAASLVVPALAADTTWTAGTGNWATDANWDNNAPTGATTNSNVTNGGTAQISNAVTAGSILNVSGGSTVEVKAGGSLAFTTGVDITGSTLLLSGSTNVGNSADGVIVLDGDATLRSQVTGTLSSAVRTFTGSNSLLAANGTTLTLGSVLLNAANQTTHFGSATDTGTIVIGTPGAVIPQIDPSTMIAVDGGRLRAASSQLPFFTGSATSTTVAAGAILDFNDQSVGGVTAVNNLLGAGTVITGSSAATTLNIGGTGSNFSGVVMGAGGVLITNVGNALNSTVILTGSNVYTGGTTIDGGYTLQLGNGGATGAIIGDVALEGTLDFKRNNTNVFGGNITGSGAVIQTGSGTTVLTGTSNYTAGTTISLGALQIGNGGTTGSITGNVSMSNNSDLIFNRSNAYTFDGDISGNGRVLKQGVGNLILTGRGTYSGATFIEAGTLSINGSVQGVAVVAQSGGTLGGTGTIEAPTTIASGGTLAPGNSIGTINITGPLTFDASSRYAVELSPTAADRTNATGAVTINGGVAAITAQAGTYVSKTYTIINGASRTGTFSTLSFTPSFGNLVINPHLVYDASNVYFVLDPASLVALLPSGLSSNQRNVGNAIDRAYAAGGDPTAIAGLFNLTGNALANALSQVSGETATGAQSAGLQSMGSFMSLMLDPTTHGGTTGFGPAIGYSQEDKRLSEAEAAMAAAMPVKAKPPYEPRWNVWAAGYGGAGSVKGNSAVGSQDITARVYGLAAGADYRITPDTLVGLALAGAGTNWGLSGNLGTGRSDAFQAGLYSSTRLGPAYISAALGYAMHWASTDRTVTVGPETLAASFHAQSFGARLETGYRFATPAVGITPFAAAQFQRFHTPSYGEHATSGPGAFALTYDARNTNATRTELGARFDKAVALAEGQTLTFNTRAAWAHDYQTDRRLNATFQTLPGASFTVDGAAPSANSALASAGAELALTNGWKLAGKFDAELARNSRSYAGTGTLRRTW